MGSLARDNAVFLGWSDTSAALIAKAADVPTPLYTGQQQYYDVERWYNPVCGVGRKIRTARKASRIRYRITLNSQSHMKRTAQQRRDQ